jgi:site-specific recombinase XerD
MGRFGFSVQKGETKMSLYAKERTDGTKAWYYDFMHQGVRYRGVGGTTKTQAKRAMEKIRHEVYNGRHDLVYAKRTLKIEDFAVTYLERRTHLRSQERDIISTNHIIEFFRGKTMSAIQPGNVEEYISHRRKAGVQNSTINRELACMKRMYNLAIKWKNTNHNPVDGVDTLKEPPGRTRYLDEHECRTLLTCCSDALRPIVFTALNTGMRLQETLQLKWDHVHIDSAIDPYIEIAISKNNKKRFIPLNEGMIDVLSALKSNHPIYVFIGERGNPLRSIRTQFKTALKKARIADFTFHDLRHTFASHFIMYGGDLLTLKELLGHSSMEMVMRYAHLAAAHKRKQINNLNEVFSNCHPIATTDYTKKKPTSCGLLST